MRLHISQLAGFDLAEAYQWYESVRPELGEDFNLCIEAAFSAIVRTPEAFQSLAIDNVRMYVIHRFPYIIYYAVTQQDIKVEAVLHSKRDPSVWQARIPH